MRRLYANASRGSARILGVAINEIIDEVENLEIIIQERKRCNYVGL